MKQRTWWQGNNVITILVPIGIKQKEIFFIIMTTKIAQGTK